MLNKILNNKKGVSELVSFVLLTLLIVTSSIIAYYFSENQLESTQINLDFENINNILKNTYYELNSIMNFDDSSITIPFSYKYGTLLFENNQLWFISDNEIPNNYSLCVDVLCSANYLNRDSIYFNLSNNYYFEENFSLPPGNYRIRFINIKNESKIKVILS